MRPLAGSFTAKVVGLTFAPDYPASIERLHEITGIRWVRGEVGDPIPADLVRQPGNEHDPNAVAVSIDLAGGMVGHLPAALAARLAVELDAGTVWVAELEEVLLHPDHLEHPGITVRLHRRCP